MNRTQAEHILDAYVLLNTTSAKEALREVILDAMTNYKAEGITFSSPWNVKTVPCSYPTDWSHTPKVTCTGIDHAFNQVTGVDE